MGQRHHNIGPSLRWLVPVLATALASPAFAQLRVPTATGSSDRAAFQQQSFPAGGFRLYPTVRLSAGYDDNVLVRGSDERGDSIFTVAPDVRAQSQWNSHSLMVDTFARFNRYGRRSALNNEEYGINSSGRLDVMRTFTINGTANYAHLYELRGTPGDIANSNQFVQFDQTQLALTGNKQINRVGVSLGGSFGAYRYAPSLGGGNVNNQRFRDRDVKGVNGRLSYQYSAVTSFFVAGSANRIRYKRQSVAFDRSSDGYSLLAGARFEITRLLSGEVGGGFIAQSFKDARFNDFKGVNYNVRLRYDPTVLTSITVGADRQISDSSIPQVGGVIVSRFTASAEHELLRNLLIAADGSYMRYNYRGLDQTSDGWSAGLGVRYQMNRYLSSALSFNHLNQSVFGGVGGAFSSNRVTLSLIASR